MNECCNNNQKLILIIIFYFFTAFVLAQIKYNLTRFFSRSTPKISSQFFLCFVSWTKTNGKVVFIIINHHIVFIPYGCLMLCVCVCLVIQFQLECFFFWILNSVWLDSIQSPNDKIIIAIIKENDAAIIINNDIKNGSA